MMFEKILGIALSAIGAIGVTLVTGQLLVLRGTVAQNNAVLADCQSGTYWCSSEYVYDLTMRNDLIGTYYAILILIVVVCTMMMIGGITVMCSTLPPLRRERKRVAA